MPGTFPVHGSTNWDPGLQTYIDAAPEFANVKAATYGATGNGTTDDTTAIHAARDAGMATVYFPPGTYKTSGLTASVTGQTWVLAAGATIQADGTNHAVSVTASGVTIKGPGKIDGGVASIYSGVFVGAGLSDVNVLGAEVAHGTYGVRCKGGTGAVTTRLRVAQCLIHDTVSHGIFFNWETTDSEISNNQIYSPGGNGIWVGNSSFRNKITGNTITSSGRIGIENFGSSTGATIVGNVIQACTSIGISVDTSNGTRVAFNRLESTGSYGLEVAASNFCVYEGNVIVSAGSHGVSISAASGTCDDNLIQGNQITAPVGGGIQAGGSANGAKRLRVIGNEVVDAGNGAGSVTAIGGASGIGCDGWIVSNNVIRWTISAASCSGINTNASNSTVTGNEIIHDAAMAASGGTGINLSAVNDCTVVGNTVVGNSKCSNGVSITSSCTGLLVADNKIGGTTSNVLNNASASTTNVITGNVYTVAAGAGLTMGGAVGANKDTGHTYYQHDGPQRFVGNVGFYSTAPIAQQTRAGQLTVAAGTPSTTTTVDVGASFSQTILNNQIATLATKLNALETIVHNLGLST